MRTIKLRDAISALRRNGLPKIEGTYFEYESEGPTNFHQDGKLIGACSIGQIAKNLHDDFGTPLDGNFISSALRTIPISDAIYADNIDDAIISFNDAAPEWTFEQVATEIERLYAEYLDKDILAEFPNEGWAYND